MGVIEATGKVQRPRTRINEVASAVKPRPPVAAHTGGRDERASTKLPRQLSRGPTTLLVINSLCQSLNEVASAVKPRHTGINAVGGVIKGGLNEVASAVKPRPIVNASPPTWPLVASTKLPRQLSRGPVTLSPRECVPIWCLNEVASAVKPRLHGPQPPSASRREPQRSCLGS